jgi:hypothetical protein
VRFRELAAAAAGRRWGWSSCCLLLARGEERRRRDAGVGAESGDHADRLRDERHLHHPRLRAPHLRPRRPGRRRRRGRRRRVESNGAAPCVVRLRRPVPRRGSRSHGERLCPNYCATVLTLRVSKQGREVIPAQLKPRTMLFYCKIIYYRAHGVLIASENIHSLVPDSQIRMMSFVSDNLSFQFLMLWDWQDGGMDNLVSYIIS